MHNGRRLLGSEIWGDFSFLILKASFLTVATYLLSLGNIDFLKSSFEITGIHWYLETPRMWFFSINKILNLTVSRHFFLPPVNVFKNSVINKVEMINSSKKVTGAYRQRLKFKIIYFLSNVYPFSSGSSIPIFLIRRKMLETLNQLFEISTSEGRQLYFQNSILTVSVTTEEKK